MARDLVLEDYPEAVIEIIDPKAAGIGERYLSMLAVEARDAGKSLDQVKEELMEVALSCGPISWWMISTI